jgi:hypothetical protein
MAKASNVIRDCLMLSLSVTFILPTNISVSYEVPDVVLQLKSRKARLKCCLKACALAFPLLLIFWRDERQRDEPRQLCGDKLDC